MSQPNVWSHPYFIKGKLNEVSNIKRVEIKGNGGKKSSSSSPPVSPSRRKGSKERSLPSRRGKEKKEKGSSPTRGHKRTAEQPVVTTDLIRATTTDLSTTDSSGLTTSNLYQQLMTERIKSKLVSELSAIDNSISSGQLNNTALGVGNSVSGSGGEYYNQTRLVSELSSGSYNSGVGSYNTAGDYNSGKYPRLYFVL